MAFPWEEQTSTPVPPSGTTWPNQGNGDSAPPWYRNEAFSGGVAAGINGIVGYLLEQERQRGYRSLQNDRFAQENEAVRRSSTMPLLQRFTKPRNRR